MLQVRVLPGEPHEYDKRRQSLSLMAKYIPLRAVRFDNDETRAGTQLPVRLLLIDAPGEN
jgi:hypothetical protein